MENSIFKCIIGFRDKKEADFFRINNKERNWDELTTIGQGLEHARRYPISKFLVESMNYDCVTRGASNLVEEEVVNVNYYFFNCFIRITFFFGITILFLLF